MSETANTPRSRQAQSRPRATSPSCLRIPKPERHTTEPRPLNTNLRIEDTQRYFDITLIRVSKHTLRSLTRDLAVLYISALPLALSPPAPPLRPRPPLPRHAVGRTPPPSLPLAYSALRNGGAQTLSPTLYRPPAPLPPDRPPSPPRCFPAALANHAPSPSRSNGTRGEPAVRTGISSLVLSRAASRARSLAPPIPGIPLRTRPGPPRAAPVPTSCSVCDVTPRPREWYHTTTGRRRNYYYKRPSFRAPPPLGPPPARPPSSLSMQPVGRSVCTHVFLSSPSDLANRARAPSRSVISVILFGRISARVRALGLFACTGREEESGGAAGGRRGAVLASSSR